MDDPLRQPRDGDRGPVRDRIRRAVADGRISQADADIRLRNVDAANSMAELDLVARDLAQVEAVIAPTSVPTSVSTSGSTSVPRSSGSTRRVVPVVVATVVALIVAFGAVALFAFSGTSGSTGSSTGVELGDPVPIEDPTPADPSQGASGEASPAGAAYALTPEGVRTFLATYRQRFGTTRTVSATFYGDYVVVQVPIPGTTRHSGWVYRQASGFTDFGGVTANFPGSTAVDLAKLNVTALFRNLARAKRVLHVADAKQAYVTIDYRPQFDPAPNVNIYLTNEFNESGYLATRLNGQVERTYAYGG